MSMRAPILLHVRVSVGQRMKQVPNRKQSETKNGTPEVEVVPDAVLRARSGSR